VAAARRRDGHASDACGRRFVPSFIDWRQWPNLVGALETANLRVQGMVVWDKGHFGLGNGFRSQHELVCHASKGVPTIYDKGIGNVLRFPRQEPVDHPSPKPEGLMQRLIAAVACQRWSGARPVRW
jgi:hypothetical protein